MVPTMMARVARLEHVVPACFDSVETVLHTGGPCAPWVKHAWLDLVGPHRLLEAYGGADSRTCTVIRGDEWLSHEGSVGRPVSGSVSVRDADGAAVPHGVVGSVFLAADGDPTGTSIGDLGRLDADGYLYLADRRTDLVVTGGVNVYPAEVEAVLGEHPDVVDAVVVGLPDDEWGQRVHAVVAVRAGAAVTAEALRGYARVRLSAPKVPGSIDLVAELPRDGAGKVRRAAVRAAALQTTGTPA
jgi:bile acid-coenzyme A ligase